MKATARAAQKLTSARLYQEGFVSRKEKEAEDGKERVSELSQPQSELRWASVL